MRLKGIKLSKEDVVDVRFYTFKLLFIILLPAMILGRIVSLIFIKPYTVLSLLTTLIPIVVAGIIITVLHYRKIREYRSRGGEAKK